LVIPRSYLYVPGNDATKLARAAERGADALIVDLEDAVPPSAKDEARATVAGWLAADRLPRDGGPEVWIRVNPGQSGHEDVRAVLGPHVRGVVAAKTESAEELATLVDEVERIEKAAGVSTGSVGVVPLLESASALLAARRIAAVPRVVRIQVGEADLAADLGMSPSADGTEWDPIRSHIVVVSAAAGIGAPVGPVSTDFRDLERLAESTRALSRRGYVGRACIHPAQVAVVNEVFTPSVEDVAWAREVVRRHEEALGRGVGVGVGPDGRMIDQAVARQAFRVIGLAR
jgi:citrate lyase subunit beta/citryl-CoA lyase